MELKEQNKKSENKVKKIQQKDKQNALNTTMAMIGTH